MLLNSFKFFKVFDSVIDFLFIAFTRGILLACFAFQAPHSLIELRALHNYPFIIFILIQFPLGQYIAFPCDSHSCSFIVSSYHPHSNSCFLASFNSIRYFFPNDVSDPCNSNKNQTSPLYFLDHFIFLVIVLMIMATFIPL